jgi:hypothetical protein
MTVSNAKKCQKIYDLACEILRSQDEEFDPEETEMLDELANVKNCFENMARSIN